MTEDPDAFVLDAIAGVSLRAPQEKYTVDGLPWGSAVLTRDVARGYGWSTVTLTLSPEAVTGAVEAGGSDVASVTFAAHGVGGIQSQGWRDDPAVAGLRALICEHQILSHPEGLRSTGGGVPAGTPAAVTLARIVEGIRRMTDAKATRYGGTECAPCGALRGVAVRAALTEKITALERAVASARSKTEAARLHMELRYAQDARSRALTYAPAPPQADCPHVPMFFQALKALCREHPELAFESVGVLQPAPDLRPPRFVLRHEPLTAALGQWLMGRTRDRYGMWEYRSRQQRNAQRHTSTRNRARQAEGLPPALREGVAFAANAWGAGADVALLAWQPDPAQADPDVVMATDPTEEERIDADFTLPEGMVVAKALPPPPPPDATTRKATAKKATAKKATAKKATAKKATAKKATAKKAAPGKSAGEVPEGEFMTADLRAQGYSAAKIKKLLDEGVLERRAHGWYRFVRAPE